MARMSDDAFGEFGLAVSEATGRWADGAVALLYAEARRARESERRLAVAANAAVGTILGVFSHPPKSLRNAADLLQSAIAASEDKGQ